MEVQTYEEKLAAATWKHHHESLAACNIIFPGEILDLISNYCARHSVDINKKYAVIDNFLIWCQCTILAADRESNSCIVHYDGWPDKWKYKIPIDSICIRNVDDVDIDILAKTLVDWKIIRYNDSWQYQDKNRINYIQKYTTSLPKIWGARAQVFENVDEVILILIAYCQIEKIG